MSSSPTPSAPKSTSRLTELTATQIRRYKSAVYFATKRDIFQNAQTLGVTEEVARVDEVIAATSKLADSALISLLGSVLPADKKMSGVDLGVMRI